MNTCQWKKGIKNGIESGVWIWRDWQANKETKEINKKWNTMKYPLEKEYGKKNCYIKRKKEISILEQKQVWPESKEKFSLYKLRKRLFSRQ